MDQLSNELIYGATHGAGAAGRRITGGAGGGMQHQALLAAGSGEPHQLPAMLRGSPGRGTSQHEAEHGGLALVEEDLTLIV